MVECHCKVIAIKPECKKSGIMCDCPEDGLDVARCMMIKQIDCPRLKQMVLKERKKIVEYIHRDLINANLYQEVINGNFCEIKEKNDDVLTLSDEEDHDMNASFSSQSSQDQ